MKLLITGGQGQLACALAQKTQGIFCDRHMLDLTSYQSIEQTLSRERPDLVINTAAYTAVDKAEQEPAAVFAVNRDGAKYLAQVSAELDIPLIHISTDYVFDGKQQHPYREEDQAHPLNVYGQSKWAGEEAVRKHHPQHIILRVSGLFSAHGNNIVKTILRLAQANKPIRFVADQVTCPTFAGDLADMILHIAQHCKVTSAWGTYHYCQAPAVSWYEFATRVFTLAGYALHHLTPTTMAEFPTPAQRPQYSVLDCQKITRAWAACIPDWSLGLGEVVRLLQ